MAAPFTVAERGKIRLYLGWSSLYRDFHTRLESAMTAIDSAALSGDPSAYDLIILELEKIAGIEAKITEAICRLSAVQVGDITLPEHKEISMLRSLGRMAAGRIASTLGVEIGHDVFGGYGPKQLGGTILRG